MQTIFIPTEQNIFIIKHDGTPFGRLVFDEKLQVWTAILADGDFKHFYTSDLLETKKAIAAELDD